MGYTDRSYGLRIPQRLRCYAARTAPLFVMKVFEEVDLDRSLTVS